MISVQLYSLSLLDVGVALELEVFWAAVANQKVPALARKLGDRLVALHLKDGFPGDDLFASGVAYDATALDLRPLGQGALDTAGILASSPATHFVVVEFDHVDGDVYEAIASSITFLEQHRRGDRPEPL